MAVPGPALEQRWYAYTEADNNGKWGWVPVVYFSGGTNDLPADGLRGCRDLRPLTVICHPCT